MTRMKDSILKVEVFEVKDDNGETIQFASKDNAMEFAIEQELRSVRSRLLTISRLFPMVGVPTGIIAEIDSIRNALLDVREDYCTYKGIVF